MSDALSARLSARCRAWRKFRKMRAAELLSSAQPGRIGRSRHRSPTARPGPPCHRDWFAAAQWMAGGQPRSVAGAVRDSLIFPEVHRDPAGLWNRTMYVFLFQRGSWNPVAARRPLHFDLFSPRRNRRLEVRYCRKRRQLRSRRPAYGRSSRTRPTFSKVMASFLNPMRRRDSRKRRSRPCHSACIAGSGTAVRCEPARRVGDRSCD